MKVSPEQAAEILRHLADRNAEILGDLESMSWDDQQLAISAGDFALIEAMRMGADALMRNVTAYSVEVPVSEEWVAQQLADFPQARPAFEALNRGE